MPKPTYPSVTFPTHEMTAREKHWVHLWKTAESDDELDTLLPEIQKIAARFGWRIERVAPAAE